MTSAFETENFNLAFVYTCALGILLFHVTDFLAATFFKFIFRNI